MNRMRSLGYARDDKEGESLINPQRASQRAEVFCYDMISKFI
jgi:hypothetical protein